MNGHRSDCLDRKLATFLLFSMIATACGGVSKSGSSAHPGGGAGGSADVATSTGGASGVPAAEPFWPDLAVVKFETPMCSAETWLGVHGLNPTKPVDYVALEVTYQYGDAVPNPIDSLGTDCDNASDQGACIYALEQAFGGIASKETCGGPPSPCQHFLVTTAGDDVQTYLPGKGYLDFLGAIDTPSEAMLVAVQGTFGGYSIRCGDDPFGGVRAVSDGYEVLVEKLVNDCDPIQTNRVLLHVGTDGTVTELRQNVESVSPDACI